MPIHLRAEPGDYAPNVLCPGDPLREMAVETLGENLELYDGRFTHNNGWFVLSSVFSAGAPHAVQWRLTPRAAEGWTEKPKLQVSQVGYMPLQPKIAVAELDRRDTGGKAFTLWRIDREGKKQVFSRPGAVWGRSLRYRCLCLDFSDVTEPGLYQIGCGDAVVSLPPCNYRLGGLWSCQCATWRRCRPLLIMWVSGVLCTPSPAFLDCHLLRFGSAPTFSGRLLGA
jgi:hypothetical protein